MLQKYLCYQYTLTNQSNAMGLRPKSPSNCTHNASAHYLLLSNRYLYLQSNLLALDTSNDNVSGILWDDFVVVQHFEF